LKAARLPVERGLTLDAEDQLRRELIMALMCQGRLDLAALEAAHGVDLERRFAAEFLRLADLQAQGLLTREGRVLAVTPLGWYFVRAVAMVFDRHLKAPRPAVSAEAPVRFSRIL
jgi:oxygen-independent coproporphyrinogen III oxidase